MANDLINIDHVSFKNQFYLLSVQQNKSGKDLSEPEHEGTSGRAEKVRRQFQREDTTINHTQYFRCALNTICHTNNLNSDTL
jgi:hypothetical protein